MSERTRRLRTHYSLRARCAMISCGFADDVHAPNRAITLYARAARHARETGHPVDVERYEAERVHRIGPTGAVER